MSESFGRLPKWAREKIVQLERERDDALRQLNDIAGDGPDPDEARIFWDPNGDNRALGGIREYDTIRIFPHRDQPEKWVDVSILAREGSLDHGITIRSDAQMAIIPHSSNVVYVDVRDQRFVKGQYA